MIEAVDDNDDTIYEIHISVSEIYISLTGIDV